MRETTPSVRLIAEPKIRWDAVRDYLDGAGGLAWYHRVRGVDEPGVLKGNGTTDAELLVEYGGRRCYRSWAPGLNANVTRVREDSTAYLRNILSVKHGSVLEHAQFTFDFDQVSRVFTHELVRHRAGVAISQESLRYVRLTDLGLRLPQILADGPPVKRLGPCDFSDAETLGSEATADYCYAHEDFCEPGGMEPMRNAVISIVERLEEFQRSASEAFGLDDEDVPFHYKKEVTSALRRLAPIGLSTGMVWSANVRTLRHVITKRTEAGAEEEIRLVFDQVARVVTEEFPALFGDFSPVFATEAIRATGIPEWVPEWADV